MGNRCEKRKQVTLWQKRFGFTKNKCIRIGLYIFDNLDLTDTQYQMNLNEFDKGPSIRRS